MHLAGTFKFSISLHVLLIHGKEITTVIYLMAGIQLPTVHFLHDWPITFHSQKLNLQYNLYFSLSEWHYFISRA
jgi:hypothetical protein